MSKYGVIHKIEPLGGRGSWMAKGGAGPNAVGRSMAVWYEQRQGMTGLAVAALHFNLWHYKPARFSRTKTFLDVGLMLSGHENVGDIFIYVPAKVKPIKKGVRDLAPKLDEPGAVVGIFNEPLTREGEQDECIDLWKSEGTGKKLFARVWRLEDGEWEKSEPCQEEPGTLIKISAKAVERAASGLPEEGKIYFRFRVHLPNGGKNPFLRSLRPWDGQLLSGFDRLECVDFRLNEIRNLPQAISRRIKDNGNVQFSIEQLHFLLATDVRADYVSGHRHFHKCRMLESGLWDDYAGDLLPPHMVTYHWKVPHSVSGVGEKKDAIADFNAFMKFRIRESNLWTIARYAFWAALIGAMGSYLSTYVPTYKPDDKSARCVQDAPKSDRAADGLQGHEGRPP